MANRMPMLSNVTLEDLEGGKQPDVNELDESGFGPALSIDTLIGSDLGTPKADAADAEEQRSMFKMHTTPKSIEEEPLAPEPPIATEPESTGIPSGQSRAGYAWEKLGNMLETAGPAKFTPFGTPTTSAVNPAPVTDAGEVPIPKISDSKLWPVLKRLGNRLTNPLLGNLPPAVSDKATELLNPFTAYEEYKGLDKKAQVDKALEWMASDERFKEIKDKYDREPMPEDATRKFDLWINDRADDLVDELTKIGGQAEGIGTLIVGLPGFAVGTAAGVSDAIANYSGVLWDYVRGKGLEKGLTSDQIFEAGSHGYQFGTYLMDKLSYHPGSTTAQQTAETLMYPFIEFEKGIDYTGWYFGWSKEQTDTAKLAFFAFLLGHGGLKGVVKPGAKAIKRKVGEIADKMGKQPLTPEETEFQINNYRKATSTDKIDKFREMQEAANQDTSFVLRGVREKTGLEDLDAFQDGTFGGSFTEFYAREAKSRRKRKVATAKKAEPPPVVEEPAPPEPAKTTRIRRKAKEVEETMQEPAQQVDHAIGNGEVLHEVATRLESKGKHDEAAKYRQQVGELIAKVPERAEQEADLARQERLAKLRAVHAEWELKRAKAMKELESEFELGGPEHVEFEQTFYTEHGRFPTDEEFAASLKKTTKVEPVEAIDQRVQDNPLFEPLETTLEKSKMYNDPDVAKRVTADPLVASQKLVNDINKYTHGDKSVNIDEVLGVLKKMEENGDKLRGYFTTQTELDAFMAGVSDAIEYGMLAKSPESVPVRNIRDLDSGVTLAMGFDPTLLKTFKVDFIRLADKSKKFTGQLAPDVMKKRLEELAKTHELNVAGVYPIIERAKKEGKKLSISEVADQIELPELKVSINDAWESTAREFPENAGYENHLYQWDIPEFYTGGHFGSYPNVLFNTRVSRKYVEGTAPADALAKLKAREVTSEAKEYMENIANLREQHISIEDEGAFLAEAAIEKNVIEDKYSQDYTANFYESPLVDVVDSLATLQVLKKRGKVNSGAASLYANELSHVIRRLGHVEESWNPTISELAAYFLEELQSDYWQKGGVDYVYSQFEPTKLKPTIDASRKLYRSIDHATDEVKKAWTSVTMSEGLSKVGDSLFATKRGKYREDFADLRYKTANSPLKEDVELLINTSAKVDVLDSLGVLMDSQVIALKDWLNAYELALIDAAKNPTKRHFIPFRESWGKNAISLEIFNAISEGAKEFNVSTAETVARAEGIIGQSETLSQGKARLKTATEDYADNLLKTLNALESTYDSGVPKWIKQFFSRYNEKVEVKRVEGSGKPSLLSESDKRLLSENVSEMQNATTIGKVRDSAQNIYDAAYMLRNTEHYAPIHNDLTMLMADARIVKESRGDTAVSMSAIDRISRAVAEISGAGGRSYWSIEIPSSFAERVLAKKEVPSIKLNSLPDPVELVKSLKREGKQLIAWVENTRQAKRLSKSKRIEQLTAKTMADVVDTKSYARKMLDLLPDQLGHDTHRRLILMNGAQTMAGIHTKRARKAVYGGLGTVKKRVLDSMIFARRIIAIDNSRAEEAIRTGKYRKVEHPKLTKEQARNLGVDEAVELDGVVAKKYLDELEAVLDPADFADLVKRSETYFNTMRDTLGVLKDRGLISTKLYNKLIRFDYEKRQDIMAKLDPETTHLIGKEPITVKESGVKSLKKGTNEDLLEIDSEMLMADVIRAAYGRAFRNDANLALRRIAEVSPDNGIVKIPKSPKDTPPRGWSRVELFIEGKKEKLFLENDFARSWLVNNNEVSFEIARRNQAISGSAILKPMATGINPEFAFANIMRDIAHIWLTSQVKVGNKWVNTYSPHLPLALPLMMKDIMMVSKDAFSRKGRWLDAVEDGMGMQFLTHEGRIFKDQPGTKRPLEALDTIQEFVGYLNESSEILGRLMVRERAMRIKAKQKGVSFERFQEMNEMLRPQYKGGRVVENPRAKELTPEEVALVKEIRREGSFTARDYMDFSLHGSKGEYVDTFIPYFNAGIQGTRGLFRAAKRNPTEFATKLAHLTAAVTTLYMINRLNNEEALKHISAEARKNNFIIATNIKITDSSGIDRYVYYKIPKDPSQKYFSYMIEQFVGKYLFDEEVDFPSVVEAVGSLFPVAPDNVLGLTPTGNALLAAYNIDSWRTMLNKDVVKIWEGGKLPEGKKHEAVVEGKTWGDTPPWARHVGDALDLEPQKVQQMIGSYVTNQGNLWTWLGGTAYDKMFGPAADEAKQNALADAIGAYERHSKIPTLRRFIGLTATESETDIKTGEDITQKYVLESVLIDRKLDVLNQDYMLGLKDLGHYVELKHEYPEFKERIEAAKERAKTIMNTDLVSPNNRSFWFFMEKPRRNEEKAELYWARYSSAGQEKRLELETELVILDHNTPDFMKELYRIMAEGE